MQNRSTIGRRRAPRPAWHARLRSSLSPQIAVKSAAAIGLVAATTAAVVVTGATPAPAAGSTQLAFGQGVSAALVSARAGSPAAASRDLARPALADATPQTPAAAGSGAPATTEVAVVSPAVAGPAVPDPVGIVGIEAVEKPPPAPKPAARSAGGPAGPPVTSAGCPGLGLRATASVVCGAVRAEFGSLVIGGYRPGDGGDHGSGRAVDIMVTGARGDAIAAWLQANAGTLGIKYLIWKQRIWMPGRDWRMMSDRGSATQNHYDHVHVSVR